MTLPLTGDRFVVTEIEGFGTSRAAGNGAMGISCHVLDTAANYRMVATFRSEQFTRTPLAIDTREARLAYIRERVRNLARERAAQLNAGQAVERQLQLSA
jgi:hypothetical protein